MKHRLFLLLIATSLLLVSRTTSAKAAALEATADLSDFLQSGTITNRSDAGFNIVEIIYSLGPAEPNLATWDGRFGSAGGIASDFLSDRNFFQTITFRNLSIAPNNSFSFSGIDIDLIQTIDPLVAVGSPAGGPETLRKAFIEAKFNNGGSAIARLQQTAWQNPQQLRLIERDVTQNPTPVPTPALLPGVISMGVAMQQRRRHAQQQHA